jgi:hypothetical protein
MVSTPNINRFPAISSHHLGILASIAHRLEVARANQDLWLVAQLEQEQRQFAVRPVSIPDRRPPFSWLQNWKRRLSAALFEPTDAQMHPFANGSDRFWYSRHPITGRWIYADSEAELRLWLEQNQSQFDR